MANVYRRLTHIFGEDCAMRVEGSALVGAKEVIRGAVPAKLPYRQ
jgi:hypothetical protein